MDQRSQSNGLRTYGQQQNKQQQVEELDEELLHEMAFDESKAYDYASKLQEQKDLQADIDSLEALTSEMDSEGMQILHLDTEDAGQAVTMYGELDENTDHVQTSVPGTGSDLGQTSWNRDRLKAFSGVEDLDDEGAMAEAMEEQNAAAIHWQGADFPSELHENLSESVFTESAKELAGFDHAMNLEIGEETRSSYVGYSAGGGILGTAVHEDYGVEPDAMTQVGSAGSGIGVESRDDLANPEMEIYWTATRDDWVHSAGPTVVGYLTEGHTYSRQMDALDAQRIESGTRPAPGDADPEEIGSSQMRV